MPDEKRAKRSELAEALDKLEERFANDKQFAEGWADFFAATIAPLAWTLDRLDEKQRARDASADHEGDGSVR